MNKYKTKGNRSLFDEQDNIEKLSLIGNPLEKISKVIDFEMFRSLLEEKLLNKNKMNKAGGSCNDVQNIDITALLWSWRYANRISDNRQNQF